MKIIIKKYYKSIFIFLIFIFYTIFFFSTGKAKAKVFKISDVEISKPFEMSFDKNSVIDQGFKIAFNELLLFIINSSDQKKIQKINLNEIKFMIESFSIKEEKFIDEVYYMNLGVSFNRKKIFKFLEKRNIFPSIPTKSKIFYLPIVIEEDKKNLFIFTRNKIFQEWQNVNEKSFLIDYILPTEDLEDLEIIKEKYDFLERYDFKEIISKYYLRDSIICLVFKNQNQIRTLSRISIKNDVFLKNRSFLNLSLDNQDHVIKIIKELKVDYEDYWKNVNQINTSIKLPIKVKVNISDEEKISKFENTLEKVDLIYDYFIKRFDNNFIIYDITYNGPPNTFLKSMSENDFTFNIQEKEWILK